MLIFRIFVYLLQEIQRENKVDTLNWSMYSTCTTHIPFIFWPVSGLQWILLFLLQTYLLPSLVPLAHSRLDPNQQSKKFTGTHLKTAVVCVSKTKALRFVHWRSLSCSTYGNIHRHTRMSVSGALIAWKGQEDRVCRDCHGDLGKHQLHCSSPPPSWLSIDALLV